MPQPRFIATHTNSDENLLGWNSRYIYLHSNIEGTIVGEEEMEVFKAIGGLKNKGTISLPKDYFLYCDDGTSFKITMYFIATLNGLTLKFQTGIIDEYNVKYAVPTKNNNEHVFANTGHTKMFKYECIITKFEDKTNNEISLDVHGSIIYSEHDNTENDDQKVNFIQQFGNVVIAGNVKPTLIIDLTGTAGISVTNVTVEQIK